MKIKITVENVVPEVKPVRDQFSYEETGGEPEKRYAGTFEYEVPPNATETDLELLRDQAATFLDQSLGKKPFWIRQIHELEKKLEGVKQKLRDEEETSRSRLEDTHRESRNVNQWVRWAHSLRGMLKGKTFGKGAKRIREMLAMSDNQIMGYEMVVDSAGEEVEAISPRPKRKKRR